MGDINAISIHPLLGDPDAPPIAFNQPPTDQPAPPLPAAPIFPDVGAAMPENYATPDSDLAVRVIKGMFNSAATLPQRAIQNSQFALDTGNYDPRVPVEAALTTMGGGAAGAPVAADEMALGAGPMRNISDFTAQPVSRFANENEKYIIPSPLDQFSRDWQNYFSKMSPDEVLDSEPAWGAVARAREAGTGAGAGLSDYVNQVWQRMGANRYISPDAAERYIRMSEGKARGIGLATNKDSGFLLGSGATDQKAAAAIQGLRAATDPPIFAPSPALDAMRRIRPPSEDIYDVLNSNFNHGVVGPKETVPIDSLTGGVRMSSPEEAQRVKALADQISGPNGYFERPIVDDAGNVVEGQHRIEALRQLGVDRVPIQRVVDLARGFDEGAMKSAAQQAGKLHPDQAHGIVREAFNSIREFGSPQAALEQTSMPAPFSSAYEAALRAAMPKPPPSIRAYHGSPHDFDQFDLAHIGNGEGAQVYGHGLYFAENPAVAQDYRSMLAGRPEIDRFKVGTKTVGPHNNFDYSPRGNSTYENVHSSLIEDLLTDENGLAADPANAQQFALDRLRDKIDAYKKEWPEAVAPAEKLYQDLSRPGAVRLKMGEQPGKSYEVNINADPEHFLDWDKPLSEQSEHVQSAIEKIYPGAQNAEMKRSRDALAELQARYPDSDPMGQQAAIKRNLQKMQDGGGLKGEELLRRLEMKQKGANAQSVSQSLRDAGIPGIKYLDQGSRDVGEGTRNYVVFNDKLVNIMRKYAAAGLPFAGAAAPIFVNRGDQQ